MQRESTFNMNSYDNVEVHFIRAAAVTQKSPHIVQVLAGCEADREEERNFEMVSR